MRLVFAALALLVGPALGDGPHDGHADGAVHFR